MAASVWLLKSKPVPIFPVLNMLQTSFPVKPESLPYDILPRHPPLLDPDPLPPGYLSEWSLLALRARFFQGVFVFLSLFLVFVFLVSSAWKLFPQILFADSRALFQYHVTFCEVFLAILCKISHMLYLLFSVATEDTVHGTSELLIFTFFFFFRAVSLEEELLTHSRDSENI